MSKKSCKKCNSNCKSEDHAAALNSSITYPNDMVLDKQIASYFVTKCYNFSKVTDSLGRNVLHMASSCGRHELCLWLCKVQRMNIDLQERNSRCTALHLSILHGFINIAVSLIQKGANIEIQNIDHLTPLEVLLDEYYPSRFDTELMTLKHDDGFCPKLELYTWGNNLNYTSGFGAENKIWRPKYVESFEKKSEQIMHVSINTYHSLFLSSTGNVWCCGLGKGGRLGLCTEETVLVPQKVPLENTLKCIAVDAGPDHSIFLCKNLTDNSTQVLTCGVNTYHQLGHHSLPTYVKSPTQVKFDSWQNDIIGVAASAYHSVAWTRKSIYTCGLHAGQLGHPKSENLTVPCFSKVTCIDFKRSSITTVAVNAAVTVVATETQIFVLSNYKYDKIDLKPYQRFFSDEQLIPKKISVIGGTLEGKRTKQLNIASRNEDLRILILFSNGKLFLWHDESSFLPCVFSSSRRLKVRDIAWANDIILICFQTGEMCYGAVDSIQDFHAKNNNGFKIVGVLDQFACDKCFVINLRKSPSIFRAARVFSDPKGDNFALIVEPAMIPILNENRIVPQMSSFSEDFKILFEEINELDPFHDITYEVDGKEFFAHKYIIASICPKLINIEPNHNGIIIIEDMLPHIFEYVLHFLYTGMCTKFDDSQLKSEEIKLLKKAAQKFSITSLMKYLPGDMHIGQKWKTPCVFLNPHSFDKTLHKSLCDTSIKGQDGSAYKTHKCILVARMPYFKMMLSGHWAESRFAKSDFQLPVSSSVLNDIIEYLYTDGVSRKVEKNNLNHWCSLLIAADQFMLKKLMAIAENAISLCLDTRNVVEILLLAENYNAEKLKATCFCFISGNIDSILYHRSLEILNQDMLNQLTNFFRSKSKHKKLVDVPFDKNACDLDEIFSADESLVSQSWNTIHESSDEISIPTESMKNESKKKIKKIQKPSSTKVANPKSEHLPSVMSPSLEVHEFTSPVSKENSLVVNDAPNFEKWVKIDRQIKLTKCRLKASIEAKNNPKLLEYKENFVALMTNPETQSPSPHQNHGDGSDIPIFINLNLENITQKTSQSLKKKLRKTSESNKSDKDSHLEECSEIIPERLSSSPIKCWESPSNTDDRAVSFLSIMAAERKQKLQIIHETKKVESKPLYLTQIEDKAIQELGIFYNIDNISDEHITVRRVAHSFNAPLWVTK